MYAEGAEDAEALGGLRIPRRSARSASSAYHVRAQNGSAKREVGRMSRILLAGHGAADRREAQP